MADDTSNASGDNKPKVELSDTSPPTATPPPDEPQKKSDDAKWFSDSKALSLIGGIIALLIIIGLGVYAALRPPREPLENGGERGGLFGELPGSGQRSISRDTSGLSGRRCDHPNRRPIGVMLAGDPINRPVSGFAAADLVFELPVLVSGVTRLTAVYQCGEPSEIGSVRSARHDYLFLSEGVDAILGHWGGSYHALNRIAVGEFQTINALTNPFNAYFRKDTLPAPYNGFTNYENLWSALQQLGYRTETKFKGYEFKDDPGVSERGIAGTLAVAWPGQFKVSYEYNPETNRYERYWAGVRQIDGIDGTTPVEPSVVAIMRAGNSFADGAGGYNDVDIEGEGDLIVYQNGQEIRGRWSKDIAHKNDPIDFVDENGDTITFTRGQVWIMAVEPGIEVTWTQEAEEASLTDEVVEE